MENSHKVYFEYLKTRSYKAFLFRKFILYPRLTKHLKGKVVDIGCGIGDFLQFRKNTVGVDVNNINIQYCRNNNFDAYEIIGNRYPFSDQMFDGAVLDNVLEHLENPSDTLQEIYRVLKPNSTLIIGVPGIKGYSKDEDHKAFYSEQVLIDTLTLHGFKLKKFLYSPLFKSQILSKLLAMYCIYGVFVKER